MMACPHCGCANDNVQGCPHCGHSFELDVNGFEDLWEPAVLSRRERRTGMTADPYRTLLTLPLQQEKSLDPMGSVEKGFAPLSLERAARVEANALDMDEASGEKAPPLQREAQDLFSKFSFSEPLPENRSYFLLSDMTASSLEMQSVAEMESKRRIPLWVFSSLVGFMALLITIGVLYF